MSRTRSTALERSVITSLGCGVGLVGGGLTRFDGIPTFALCPDAVHNHSFKLCPDFSLRHT